MKIVLSLIRLSIILLIVTVLLKFFFDLKINDKEMILVLLATAMIFLIDDSIITVQTKDFESNNDNPKHLDSVQNTNTKAQHVPANQVKENEYSTPAKIIQLPNIESRWKYFKDPQSTIYPPKPLNQNTDEYKIYPGIDSVINIRPGFHDRVIPYNTENLTKQFGSYQNLEKISTLTSEKTLKSMMGGGNESGNGESDYRSNKNAEYRVPNNDLVIEPRLNNVVYSGDLIELVSGDLIIQRASTSSQVLLDKPLPQIRSNLSKLRFENAFTPEKDQYSPIRYKQQVMLKHNALIDNKNQIRMIKYGERLQSHQSGPAFDLFKLINKDNPDSTDYVKYGDQFYIICGDQSGDKVFLKLESDHSISSEARQSEAIVFSLLLIKPYNPVLPCVCPNEFIFP